MQESLWHQCGRDMAYKLIISERAETLLDNIVQYLVYTLKNEQAAIRLFNEIDSVYSRLEENPNQFPVSKDVYLERMNYQEAILSNMNYVVIFRIEEKNVYVTGIYHQLEDYRRKIDHE